MNCKRGACTHKLKNSCSFNNINNNNINNKENNPDCRTSLVLECSDPGKHFSKAYKHLFPASGESAKVGMGTEVYGNYSGNFLHKTILIDNCMLVNVLIKFRSVSCQCTIYQRIHARFDFQLSGQPIIGSIPIFFL